MQQLTSEIESQIETKLLELSDQLVINNFAPDTASLNPALLTDVANYLKTEVITPNVISSTIFDRAFSTILEAKNYEEGKENTKKFSEFSYVDIAQFSKDLLSYLKELPKSYTFLLRLPGSVKKIPLTKLSDNIEIFTAEASDIKKYVPENRTFGSLLTFSFGETINLKENDIILKLTNTGYVGKFDLVEIYSLDPIYTLKVVVGIYLALDIIHRGRTFNPRNFTLPYSYYVFDTLSNSFVRKFDESTNDENYIRRIEFNESSFELSKLATLTGKKTTPFDTANDILTKIFLPFDKLEKISAEESEKFQTIVKNTSYWFFETLKTPEEHIRAVYLTTAFDSLLGFMENEKDIKEMKSEIIANTAATNAREAIIIRNTIKRLYLLRNEIIHGKKPISALDKYHDQEKSDKTLDLSLYYFFKFFANRIHFLVNGIKLKK